MGRFLAAALTCVIALPGCGTYGAWSKRREARALERSIAAQQKKLERMSPAALERAEAASREKAISQYEKILEEYADVGREEMDEALYLLGRLLFEREQQEFQRGQRTFDESTRAAEAAGSAAPEEPTPRYPGAKAVYERLLREFPDSSLREDALYDLGYILFEEGDLPRAKELFETLVREAPRSRYAAEVHFRLGEQAFESYDLAAAEGHYRAVLRRGQTDLTEKALFKLAWVYYNLDRHDDAKTVLADLLQRETRKVEREGREFAPAPILFFPGPRRAVPKNLFEATGSDLYQEALEIIARVYLESGGADALLSFIRTQQKGKKTPPFAAPLMHRLALVAKERAQFDDAARAYERLLDSFPTFRDSPEIELEYVQVLIDQKQLDRAAKAREAMLEKYDSGSAWALANPEEEVRQAALKAARKGLAWSIRYYHARGLEAQKESAGVPEDLRHAIRLYEKYLTRFPEGKPSYDRRFRYAQALFAAGEFQKAADVFWAVSFDPTFDHKREEAAFARILSVEKLAEGRTPPLPPTVIESLVAAYEDFLSLNPQSEKNAALLFKEGQLYFEAESYPPAIAAFTRLIDGHGADPLAAEAHDLIAQAHFRLGEFPIAERWAEKALQIAGPGNALGARRDDVEKLYALSMFRQGETAEAEKQFTEATQNYLRLVDRLPRNEIAPRALYNAAVATGDAGTPPEAARLFERLLADYVDSDLAPDAAARLAAYYEEQPGGSEEIIRIYERVADFHVDSPQGAEFLFLAGKLAVKENRAPETLRLFEKYLSRYRGPDQDRAAVALYHLGVTYAAAGQSALARTSLDAFLSRPRPTQPVFGEGNEGYSYAAANSQLLLGQMVEQEYERVRIVPPIRENLTKKERLLGDVVQRYAAPVASGLSPLATEASYRIGHAYEEFAGALEDAPKPPGLSAEERGEYDQLLEQQIRPYLAKAVDAYRITVRASREKSIEDEWVSRCRERLARVAPRVYPRAPRPGYVALPAPTAVAPELLQTFGGNAVNAGSGPGFFGSLLASDTEVRQGAFAKGLQAAASGDWAGAEKHFAEAAPDGPPEAGTNHAIALEHLGRTADAARALEGVLQRFPTFHSAIFLSAVFAERGGKRDLAASYYRKAAEAAQATGEQRAAWGRFLERNERNEEALSAYQSALSVDPDNAEAALGIARLSEDAGEEDLATLVPRLRNAPSLVELGILAARRGVPRIADQAFGAARTFVLSNHTDALAIVLVDQALAAQELGDLDRAEGLLGTAREADGSLAAVANTAGILRMRRGDFASAETEFRKALEDAPAQGAPWANLGILNELYFGMPEAALDCYTRYLATRPDDAGVVSDWIQEIREGMS